MLSAVLSVALGAVPDEHATTRGSLTAWDSWFSNITDVALEGVGVTCKTNWDAFVDYRTTACPQEIDCASWGSPPVFTDTNDRLKLYACCYEGKGEGHYLPITGPDPANFDNPDDADSIDEMCSQFVREQNNQDGSCCSACGDPDSASYPFTCTEENYVAVSVCSGTGCDENGGDCEGAAALAPLPSDSGIAASPPRTASRGRLRTTTTWRNPCQTARRSMRPSPMGLTWRRSWRV